MLIENNIGFSIDPRRTPQGGRAERSHLLTPLRRVVSGTIAPQPVQCFPSDMLLIYWLNLQAQPTRYLVYPDILVFIK